MNTINTLEEIKLRQLDFEEKFLSPFAAFSGRSRGRATQEESCTLRTEFQRDRDRILHTKAFRRLKHKTQVFISPVGDHFRTRLTHTLEVSQVARTIARALRLNEDLTEAISLGHDLGHTPFGHTGEDVLNRLLPGGFRHNEQSVRVVSIIENINLTQETVDGILNHTGINDPYTLEGQIVKIADRVAYLNHDIDDAIRAGIIGKEDLPSASIKVLGNSARERITAMIKDMVQNSLNRERICMSKECTEAMNELREWMFANVYIDSPAKLEEHKAVKIITELYGYYMENFDLVEWYVKKDKDSKERIIADYIACMTDRYALQQYMEKFIHLSGGINYRQF